MTRIIHLLIQCSERVSCFSQLLHPFLFTRTLVIIIIIVVVVLLFVDIINQQFRSKRPRIHFILVNNRSDLLNDSFECDFLRRILRITPRSQLRELLLLFWRRLRLGSLRVNRLIPFIRNLNDHTRMLRCRNRRRCRKCLFWWCKRILLARRIRVMES